VSAISCAILDAAMTAQSATWPPATSSSSARRAARAPAIKPAGPVYGEADVERLRFIRAGRALAFSIAELRQVIALRDRGERPCAQIMRPLNARQSDVDAQLRALRAELRALIEVAAGMSLQPRDDEPCVCDLIGDERDIVTLPSLRTA
jgi:hypothetical protein